MDTKGSILGIAALLLSVGASLAADHRVSVDANIVTGLDVSDSIGRHEEWIERDGLARAVVHPSVLQSISAGAQGRIGFAVYTWSSHGRSEFLIPWTIIATPDDAARISQRLLSIRLIDESYFSGGDHDDDGDGVVIDEHLTDTADAIRLGANHLRSAPFAAPRLVMNIVGNGSSNTGENPISARQDALADGLVINGLIAGGNLPRVVEHYRAEVIGGPGSFLMQATDPDTMPEAFAAKLRMDIAGLNGRLPHDLTFVVAHRRSN